MLKSFYEQRGFSRSNFSKWAKRLLEDFIPGIDYEVVNGDYSFEATAKVIILMRLAEKYPNDSSINDIHQALVEANISIKPFYILEDEHFWPSIVHGVHTIWRSRRKDKLAEVGDNEIDKEFLTTIVTENADIVLSAPKSMLPESDPKIEENDSPPIYKRLIVYDFFEIT